jgi:hypothetical protein
MVTDRLMEQSKEGENPTLDENLLGISLVEDEHHFETPVSFFKQAGTLTKIYEDGQGPICFARVTKSLRLDIHFLDNDESKRNASVLCQGIGPLVEQAKGNNYTEIVFTTNVEKLKDFCVKAFNFEVVPDTFVLRKYL